MEDAIGKPLSPYAVTKYVNELYADVFARCYGFSNHWPALLQRVRPRQDPEGAYAAVIPKWIASLIKNEPVYINGDGDTSRDFCFIANVVQANLLAATTPNPDAKNQVYNVAVGDRTSLNELYAQLHRHLLPRYPRLAEAQPVHRDFRAGDVRHSLADIGKAERLLGYAPTQRLAKGWHWPCPGTWNVLKQFEFSGNRKMQSAVMDESRRHRNRLAPQETDIE